MSARAIVYANLLQSTVFSSFRQISCLHFERSALYSNSLAYKTKSLEILKRYGSRGKKKHSGKGDTFEDDLSYMLDKVYRDDIYKISSNVYSDKTNKTTDTVKTNDTSKLSNEEILFCLKRDLRIRLKLSELRILNQYRKEYELLVATGEKVPKTVPLQMWVDLIDTSERIQRMKVYAHYYEMEKSSNDDALRDQESENKMQESKSYDEVFTLSKGELREISKEEIIQYIQKEHEVSVKTRKFRVPKQLTENDLEELYECASTWRRLEKYTKYLDREQEELKRNLLTRREEELTAYENKLREGILEEENDYESKSTCYVSPTDEQIQKHYNNKQVNAQNHGPEIVFDIGYGKYERDSINYQLFVERFWKVNDINMIHNNPFHFILCNAPEKHPIIKYMKAVYPEEYSKQLFTVSTLSVRDLAKDRKLVYLVNNAEKTMDYYDHDAVYVIPAIHNQYNIDDERVLPVETQKLPLHDFVQ